MSRIALDRTRREHGVGLTRPVLLLDVDGVLNPFPPFEARFEALPAARCRYDPTNAERLGTLLSKFEIVWCTGWEDKANEFIAPAHGLPELEVIRFDYSRPELQDLESWDGEEEHFSWKLSWIRRWLRERGEPAVAWLDDQLEDDAYRWAVERNRQGHPTLLVKTQETVGLTARHTHRLLQWAAGL